MGIQYFRTSFSFPLSTLVSFALTRDYLAFLALINHNFLITIGLSSKLFSVTTTSSSSITYGLAFYSPFYAPSSECHIMTIISLVWHNITRQIIVLPLL